MLPVQNVKVRMCLAICSPHSFIHKAASGFLNVFLILSTDFIHSSKQNDQITWKTNFTN